MTVAFWFCDTEDKVHVYRPDVDENKLGLLRYTCGCAEAWTRIRTLFLGRASHPHRTTRVPCVPTYTV